MTETRQIYLDNAATTRVDARVASVVSECMLESYGNPSSAHCAGIEAERRVRTATSQLAKAIGDPDGSFGRILWTSGGTESDAMGVLGAGRTKKKARKVVVSAIEHPAVKQSAAMLSEMGWEFVELAVGARGVATVEAVHEAVDADTGVMAIMLVNNEIATIAPIAELATAARELSPEIHVHCDAVQALGKIEVNVAELGADSVAFAAHKLHGPKGVGALWLKNGARIRPFWAGGGQQGGLRSGTDNVPGIAGMGAAAELACEDLSARQAAHQAFAATIITACKEAGLRFQVNAETATRAPHVLSLAFDACPAEPLLHVLESRGVLVSAGSACAEKSRKPSPVLTAIGVPKTHGTLRISFGRDTTAEDITTASEILIDAVRSFQS
ncbi:MAG: cysteine desulfurase [Myxococcales bacterium]|nr:cysteine desulfurase [Myxococcales bacterium]